MNKLSIIAMMTFFKFISFATLSQAAEVEYYTTKAILLENRTVPSTYPSLNKRPFKLSNVAPFQFAVDDSFNIYVLDIYDKKILKIGAEGSLVNEILLRGAEFPYTNKDIDDGHMDYLIQVSKNGNMIYVTDGSEDYQWSVFNEKGARVRKNITLFSSFERVCGDFRTEDKVLDENLNEIKQVTKHVFAGEVFDSKFNFYSIKGTKKETRPYLIKRNVDRKEVWKIELNYKRSVRLLGVDGEDNIYVLVEESNGIVKVNKEGHVVANIAFPKDPLFLNGKFKKGIFRILCDGTIYYFPPAVQPLSKQMKNEEYAVYKFDKVRKIEQQLLK